MTLTARLKAQAMDADIDARFAALMTRPASGDENIPSPRPAWLMAASLHAASKRRFRDSNRTTATRSDIHIDAVRNILEFPPRPKSNTVTLPTNRTPGLWSMTG